MIKKVCTKCYIEYPATAEYFCKEKGGKYGVKAQCKVCQAIRGKLYSKEHRRERREYDKRYRQTLTGYLKQIYRGMKKRCTNPNRHNYKWYGGRGIENRFLTSDQFVDYVIKKLGITEFEQVRGLQVDRVDNNGDYEPGNIRFVTAKVNANNRRDNVK